MNKQLLIDSMLRTDALSLEIPVSDVLTIWMALRVAATTPGIVDNGKRIAVCMQHLEMALVRQYPEVKPLFDEMLNRRDDS